jgi:hypothetical protein
VTDIPFRVFGPAPLNGGAGEVLFTARPGTSKFFIRDISLTNTSSAANDIRVRMSVGGITDLSNRVVDRAISFNSDNFIRPLWLLDENETLEGLQVIAGAASSPTLAAPFTVLQTGTDGTAFTNTAWTPAANTLYLLAQANGVASGTTALNPSSITGNGTWTLINQTTSTVAAARNIGMSIWWFYSSATGSSATTTINFASTQHSCLLNIFSVANVFPGGTAVPPWTSTATPVIQSATAADSVAPGAGTDSKTVTLTALQAGLVIYWCGRAINGTAVAPTGFTEGGDLSITDVSGSVGSAQAELSSVTTPPHTSTTVGPATFSTSTADARAAIAFELVPAGWVNCMVSGIEVH